MQLKHLLLITLSTFLIANAYGDEDKYFLMENSYIQDNHLYYNELNKAPVDNGTLTKNIALENPATGYTRLAFKNTFPNKIKVIISGPRYLYAGSIFTIDQNSEKKGVEVSYNSPKSGNQDISFKWCPANQYYNDQCVYTP